MKRQQFFEEHYRRLAFRVLFRWVDARKRAIVLSAIGERRDLEILDLGCGTGELTKGLTVRHRVFGVDHDARILKHATANGLIATEGPFQPLLFEDQKFDVVLMIDTLEHVSSRVAVAKEIRRVLKAKGQFIAITPCYTSCLWLAGERFVHLLSGTRGSGHISPFTPESMEYFMETHFRSHQIGRLNFGMWIYALGTMPVGRNEDRR